MKKLIVSFCLVLLLGCSSNQVYEKYSSLPILLEHSELPLIPQRVVDPEFRFVVKMLVNESGKVSKVVLVRGSGDAAWDLLAVNSIEKWKYEPAIMDGKPVSTWLIQNVRVQFENPYYLVLSQILCDSYETALSVVAKLNEGSDFGELAQKYSCDSSRHANGFLGKKDVLLYPQQINRVLKRLAVGEYTQPIEYGNRYVIFKRNKS